MHFIGTFKTTDNIIVCDPFAGKIAAEYLDISEHNLKRFDISAQTGVWYAHHYYGNHKHPIALILMEESCYFQTAIESIDIRGLKELGSIVSSFGHMVAAVDRQTYNNALFTYIKPTENIVYRIKDIRKWLEEPSAMEEKRAEKILSRLNRLEENNRKYIESNELFPLCNVDRIPVESDLWASDCYFRLKNNPINATAVVGGIIAKTYSAENMVYIDDEKNCRLIYIDLDMDASKAPRFRTLL